LVALSANTSELLKSPGQDWWPSSGTPQGITGLGVAWCGWTTVVVGSQ
jgi:hypothetical protein